MNKELSFLNNKPAGIYSTIYQEIYSNFSYENFLKSLEKNIKKHVKSLANSDYKNKIIIFIMEQQSGRAFVPIDGFRVEFYKLHKDKSALSIIKNYCLNVDYVIYYVGDSVEIISLSKIDELLNSAIIYKNLKVGRAIKTETNILIKG